VVVVVEGWAGGVVRRPGSWKSLSAGGPTVFDASWASAPVPAATARLDRMRAAARRLRRFFGMSVV
jgi:hypothetical protein